MMFCRLYYSDFYAMADDNRHLESKGYEPNQILWAYHHAYQELVLIIGYQHFGIRTHLILSSHGCGLLMRDSDRIYSDPIEALEESEYGKRKWLIK